RLYPHPPHQRLHVTTADLAPLGDQQALQHPRAGERKLQMQPVKTSHNLQVGRRHRTWQVVDTATADVQGCRLFGDRQIVRRVDHRFALSKPALPSAPSKKLSWRCAPPVGIETGSVLVCARKGAAVTILVACNPVKKP